MSECPYAYLKNITPFEIMFRSILTISEVLNDNKIHVLSNSSISKNGLNIIEGRVTKIKTTSLRLPHIGWAA